MLGPLATILDVMIHCLLTMVLRVLPPKSTDFHPLKCSDECVEAARKALQVLVEFGQLVLRANPSGWNLVINT